MAPASESGNLFEGVPLRSDEELFTELISAPHLRVERIVSTGQPSPEAGWFDQAWSEWVVVLSGEARLVFESEAAPRRLKPGDYIFIPPRRRHRVVWTDPYHPTVWLAVHYDETGV
jgi:cupin 2 domain-containing protein